MILLGCEEQLLPSWQSLASPDPEALCEERRLFYVAATRAKDRLILTHAATRGGRHTAGPSRFLYEAGLLGEPPPAAGRLNAGERRPPCGRTNPARTMPSAPTRTTPTGDHHAEHPREPGCPRAPTPQAGALLRRPFAPGAIGFRAMMKVPLQRRPVRRRAGRRLHRRPIGGAAPQRMSCPAAGARSSACSTRRQGGQEAVHACRLTITLPVESGGPDVEAVYEDVGEMDVRLARRAEGALLRRAQARRRRRRDRRLPVHGARAGRAADRARTPGRSSRSAGRAADLLAISAATEQWLRHGYEARMSTDAVRRDLGEILAHGEPETGMGQGEAAEPSRPARRRGPRQRADQPRRPTGTARSCVDFGGLGPAAA